MSIPCKFERSILSHDEMRSSCGAIIREFMTPNSMTSGALRQRLRDMRNRERNWHARSGPWNCGKGPPKGGGFPGTVEHPLQRKQVFAAALKRVNKEIDRIGKLEATLGDVQRLAVHCPWFEPAQFPPRPSTSDTTSEGMRPNRASGDEQAYPLPRSQRVVKPPRMRASRSRRSESDQ